MLAVMSLFDREAILSYPLQSRYVECTDDQTEFEDDLVTLRAYADFCKAPETKPTSAKHMISVSQLPDLI
jgi:hypothetical protein